MALEAEHARSAGPAADVSEVLSGGHGVFIGSAVASPLPEGWLEEERVAAGRAVSYRSVGDLPGDGRFELVEDATADYRVRILIRRPAESSRHNGTVVVEWLNVSGGVDANPDHRYLADELIRGGYAWVGVSAQHIGVEGGQVLVSSAAGEGIAGQGLRRIDPERYGSLQHPGDAFAYDIYTQVARALRRGDGLGDLRPERLLAVGESQSAFMLTTYANGVQPRAGVYDGFLVHSRGAYAAPLGEAGRGIDVTSAFIGQTPTVIRDDLDVPVLVLETETDVALPVLNYLQARQPDTDRFRLWEVAGTAHADTYQLGPFADALECGGPINDGPQHFVVKAALRALDRWVRDGTAPPAADRLEVAADGTYRRDEDGIVVGGVRTPPVDAPTSILSGEPRATSNLLCLLLGSTTPIPADRLAARYGSRAAYVDAFTRATDAAIDAGFVLPEDREALLATANPGAVPG